MPQNLTLPETLVFAVDVAPVLPPRRHDSQPATTATTATTTAAERDPATTRMTYSPVPFSRCTLLSRSCCSVVDPFARVGVEEVEGSDVDGHLDRLALLDRRPRAEAADEQRARAAAVDVRPDCRRTRVAARAPSRRRSAPRCVPSTVKWTISSDPSASRSSTTPRRRRSAGGVRLERRILEVLWTDAEDHGSALVAASAGRRSSIASSSARCCLPTSTARPPLARVTVRLDHVHRRRADEAADEQVHGPVVQRLRIGDLLQLALPHDGDAVAHRHRLDLVVRDVDRRRAEVALERG